MKESLAPITRFFTNTGRFFFAHNRMIYFVFFVAVLIGAIASLNLALYKPSDEDYRAKRLTETQSPRFDTDTIKKIQNLNTQQQTYTDTLPSNQRINPFGE